MKRALQFFVALGGIVPVAVGASGVLFGLAMTGDTASNPDLDSHFRYLSGLLLAIGLSFWSTIASIESKGARFRLLTFIVVAGGLARLYGLASQGMPGTPMMLGLVMELVVTPALCLWQARVESVSQRRGEKRELLSRSEF